MVKQRLADAGAAGLDVERVKEIARAVEAGDPEQAFAVLGQVDLLFFGGGEEVGGLVLLRRDPSEGLAQNAFVQRRSGRDLIGLRAPHDHQACIVQPSTPMAA